MGKTKFKRLREEELQETPVVTEQPVPATEDEIAQAVTETVQEEIPAETQLAEPAVEETPEVEEVPSEDPMFTPPAEGYVPAGWVKIEDLAAAVAQATGDVTPAEIAPDVQVSNEENTVPAVPADVVEEQPLVAEPQEITESVKCAAEKAVAEDEHTDMVSGDLPKQDKITESDEVCPECGKNPCECDCEEMKECGEECIGEECEEVEEFDEAKKSNDVCFGTALAKKKNTLNKMTSKEDLAAFVKGTCEPLVNDKEQEDYLKNMLKTINKGNFAKSLMYVYNIILKGEGQGVLKEAEDDNYGKSMQEVIDAYIEKQELTEAVEDEDLDSAVVEEADAEMTEDVASDEAIIEDEVADEAIENVDIAPETLDAIDVFIAEDTAEDEENKDYIGNLDSFLSAFESEATEAKEESDDILGNLHSAADALEQSSSFLRDLLDEEDVDYGVDVSHLNFGNNEEDSEEEDTLEEDTFEEDDFEDEEFVEDTELEEGIIDKLKAKGFEKLGGMEALNREIEEYKANPDKYKHNPLKGMVDALLIKRGYMDEDHNWIEDTFEDEDFDDECEDFDESKKLDEKIIYPAGSEPAKEDSIPDLYKNYAESAAAKRRALASFREELKAKRSNRRFDEALRSYSHVEEEEEDSNSWESQRRSKMEESKKLSYRDLLENGFLG